MTICKAERKEAADDGQRKSSQQQNEKSVYLARLAQLHQQLQRTDLWPSLPSWYLGLQYEDLPLELALLLDAHHPESSLKQIDAPPECEAPPPHNESELA